MSELMCRLRHASKLSRDRQKKMTQENPQLWVELRLEHNAILREWSYKGTTYVNGMNRRGVEKRCLTRITRASREAAYLPPLFQHTPDLRQTRHQWASNRDYKGEIRKVIETLNPPKSQTHLKPDSDIARVLEQLRGPMPTGVEDDDFNLVVLDVEIGILFCEEILKAAEPFDGPDKILKVFERMDIDSNNQLSPFELSTFFRSIGLRIESRDVTNIFKYLQNGEDAITDTPLHFAKQTRALMAKYEKSRKAYFFSAHQDNIAEAEQYFRRQVLHDTRPITVASII